LVAVGAEQQAAIRERHRCPLVAGRVERRAEIDGLAPGVALERYEPQVVTACTARPVGEEIDAGAVRRERGIELVPFGVERDVHGRAPPVGRPASFAYLQPAILRRARLAVEPARAVGAYG